MLREVLLGVVKGPTLRKKPLVHVSELFFLGEAHCVHQSRFGFVREHIHNYALFAQLVLFFKLNVS